MKKGDIILLSGLIVIFLGIYLFTDVFSFSNNSKYEIHIRDTEGNITVKELDDEGKFTIKSDDEAFFNEYEIKDGFVNMINSNCRDKICVNMKKISKDGEMIVCLPHKVYISIHKKGAKSDDGGIDAIAE